MGLFDTWLDHDPDYERGKEDAKNADVMDEIGHIGAGIFAGDSYNSGWEDGIKERDDS